MRRFFIIYYAIYGLIILLVFYVASHVVQLLNSLKEWGWYTYYSELPSLAGKLMYFIGFVMVISMGIELFFKFKKRDKLKTLEKEVLTLKAKLYDRDIASKEDVPAIAVPNTADHLVEGDFDDADENSVDSE